MPWLLFWTVGNLHFFALSSVRSRLLVQMLPPRPLTLELAGQYAHAHTAVRPYGRCIMRLKVLLTRRWWVDEVKSCDKHRLAVSFWSCASFVGLGVSLVVFGPTLLDVAHRLQVGVGLLSLMFLVRAIGSVLGTVGSGVLMDHLHWMPYTLLCLIVIGGMAATAVVPLSVHIAMLGVVMFLSGIAFGALDNGVHAVLLKMWRGKSGPCMQFLHFAYAFGAFIAPLVAKPFIQEISDSNDSNHSYLFNCTDLTNVTVASFCDGGSSGCDLLPVCMDIAMDACNATATGTVDIVYDDSNPSNCSLISASDTQQDLKYGWAYWISALVLVPPLLAYIYFAVRYDFRKCKQTKPSSGNTLQVVSSDDTENQEELIDQKNSFSGNELQDKKKSSTIYKVLAFFLLFLFMLVYAGTEISYGNLVFTYAVKSELGFSKQRAATVAAVFWGPFAFARLFSVVLALLKVHASIMMTMNLTGSLVATTLFIVAPHNDIVIWIVSAALGASFASIFPTAMTWMSEHLDVSGKTTAVVVAGGNLGDILVPSAVGALIGNVDPDAFIYCTFGAVVLSALLIALLFLMTFVHKRYHSPPVKGVRYKKLEQMVDFDDIPEVSFGIEPSIVEPSVVEPEMPMNSQTP